MIHYLSQHQSDHLFLKNIYSNLHLQELEHIDSFIKMAKVYFDPGDVDYRTEEILQKEAEITSSLPWRSAIHWSI